MGTGYDAAAWSDFAVAVAGAAAALCGLLFVAVSINIQPILSIANLPSRAAQTLILLAVPLFTSVALLVPGQPSGALATELIVGGGLSGAALLWLSRPATRSAQETRAHWLSRSLPSAAVGILLVLAGITLAAGSGGGLYWVAPVVLLAFLAGLGNAWVLLVEILR